MNFHFEIQKCERMWTCESLAEFHKAGWITDVLYRVKGGKEAMVFCCVEGLDAGRNLIAAKVYR